MSAPRLRSVIADVSIVTLALPQLLDQLHTSIVGVAAVLGLYTLVLGLALPVFALLSRRVAGNLLTAGGLAIFAVGAIVCASAGSLGLLLLGRVIQAVGGAAALVGAFGLLGGEGTERRAWLAAAVLSCAAGPALGGALTEAFDWRAIFIVQAPLAGIGALVAFGSASPYERSRARSSPQVTGAGRAVPSLALLLLSGALSAVLFLLVLLLVAGWDVSPWHAALAVSALPLAAGIGTRIRGDARAIAGVGCLLVAGGTVALAWIPRAALL